MKKTFIIAALFIGFSVVGFSQTSMQDSTITSTHVEIQNYEDVVMKNGMRVNTGNSNVTVVPGEPIIILSDETGTAIAVKENGQYVGTVTSTLYRDGDKNNDGTANYK